eukprot:m.211627 g.211627  ORF g.211627 m.211627 type:complete len:104 (+) comp18661_c0_seq1:57-368(+)
MSDSKGKGTKVARRMQWIYLGPVIGAPITHICVTFYRKTPVQHRKKLLWGGIFGTTVMAVANRLYLMNHAGYPGGQGDFARFKTVPQAADDSSSSADSSSSPA